MIREYNYKVSQNKIIVFFTSFSFSKQNWMMAGVNNDEMQELADTVYGMYDK